MVMVNWNDRNEKEYEYFSKTWKKKTTIWSSSPTSGYIIEGNEMSISKNIYTTMSISTPFAIAKMCKHQRPWKDEWKIGTGKSGTCLHMCVHAHARARAHTHTHTQKNIIQTEKYLANCDNTDDPGRHYVKWNKPTIERQTLYHLIYLKNLKKLNLQDQRIELWLSGVSGYWEMGRYCSKATNF